jgi:hypothetical protein
MPTFQVPGVRCRVPEMARDTWHLTPAKRSFALERPEVRINPDGSCGHAARRPLRAAHTGRVVPGASGLSPLYDVKISTRLGPSPKRKRWSLRRRMRFGGASRDRTGDLKLAKLALSQLSYGPIGCQVSGVGCQETLTPDTWHLTPGGGPGKI